MRLFAALPIPATAVARLFQAIEPARARLPRVKFVASAGMHVTLHFFGECTEKQLADLRPVFADPALRVPAITGRFDRLGQFPERGPARVLWAGFGAGAREMRTLWEAFEARIASQGWEKDPRGFSPHLTLARAGRETIPGGWSDGIVLPSEEFLIDECILFQSILDRSGATYHPLCRMGLGRGTE
jgi:RNA 2',3'-cyclic 3'-phosphodiesterase